MASKWTNQTALQRVLSLLLAVIIVMCSVPTAVSAIDGDTMGFSGDSSSAVVIGFSALDPAVSSQKVALGTSLQELNLPNTLAATLQQGDAVFSAALPVASWNANPFYEDDRPGEYRFIPTLSQATLSLTLGASTSLPEILVEVEEEEASVETGTAHREIYIPLEETAQASSDSLSPQGGEHLDNDYAQEIWDALSALEEEDADETLTVELRMDDSTADQEPEYTFTLSPAYTQVELEEALDHAAEQYLAREIVRPAAQAFWTDYPEKHWLEEIARLTMDYTVEDSVLTLNRVLVAFGLDFTLEDDTAVIEIQCMDPGCSAHPAVPTHTVPTDIVDWINTEGAAFGSHEIAVLLNTDVGWPSTGTLRGNTRIVGYNANGYRNINLPTGNATIDTGSDVSFQNIFFQSSGASYLTAKIQSLGNLALHNVTTQTVNASTGNDRGQLSLAGSGKLTLEDSSEIGVISGFTTVRIEGDVRINRSMEDSPKLDLAESSTVTFRHSIPSDPSTYVTPIISGIISEAATAVGAPKIIVDLVNEATPSHLMEFTGANPPVTGYFELTSTLHEHLYIDSSTNMAKPENLLIRSDDYLFGDNKIGGGVRYVLPFSSGFALARKDAAPAGYYLSNAVIRVESDSTNDIVGSFEEAKTLIDILAATESAVVVHLRDKDIPIKDNSGTITMANIPITIQSDTELVPPGADESDLYSLQFSTVNRLVFQNKVQFNNMILSGSGAQSIRNANTIASNKHTVVGDNAILKVTVDGNGNGDLEIASDTSISDISDLNQLQINNNVSAKVETITADNVSVGADAALEAKTIIPANALSAGKLQLEAGAELTVETLNWAAGSAADMKANSKLYISDQVILNGTAFTAASSAQIIYNGGWISPTNDNTKGIVRLNGISGATTIPPLTLQLAETPQEASGLANYIDSNNTAFILQLPTSATIGNLADLELLPDGYFLELLQYLTFNFYTLSPRNVMVYWQDGGSQQRAFSSFQRAVDFINGTIPSDALSAGAADIRIELWEDQSYTAMPNRETTIYSESSGTYKLEPDSGNTLELAAKTTFEEINLYTGGELDLKGQEAVLGSGVQLPEMAGTPLVTVTASANSAASKLTVVDAANWTLEYIEKIGTVEFQESSGLTLKRMEDLGTVDFQKDSSLTLERLTLNTLLVGGGNGTLNITFTDNLSSGAYNMVVGAPVQADEIIFNSTAATPFVDEDYLVQYPTAVDIFGAGCAFSTTGPLQNFDLIQATDGSAKYLQLLEVADSVGIWVLDDSVNPLTFDPSTDLPANSANYSVSYGEDFYLYVALLAADGQTIIDRPGATGVTFKVEFNGVDISADVSLDTLVHSTEIAGLPTALTVGDGPYPIAAEYESISPAEEVEGAASLAITPRDITITLREDSDGSGNDYYALRDYVDDKVYDADDAAPLSAAYTDWTDAFEIDDLLPGDAAKVDIDFTLQYQQVNDGGTIIAPKSVWPHDTDPTDGKAKPVRVVGADLVAAANGDDASGNYNFTWDVAYDILDASAITPAEATLKSGGLISKVYDGTQIVTDPSGISLELDGVYPQDQVTATMDHTRLEFGQEDVTDGTPCAVVDSDPTNSAPLFQLVGADAGNYYFEEPAGGLQGEIIPRKYYIALEEWWDIVPIGKDYSGSDAIPGSWAPAAETYLFSVFDRIGFYDGETTSEFETAFFDALINAGENSKLPAITPSLDSGNYKGKFNFSDASYPAWDWGNTPWNSAQDQPTAGATYAVFHFEPTSKASNKNYQLMGFTNFTGGNAAQYESDEGQVRINARILPIPGEIPTKTISIPEDEGGNTFDQELDLGFLDFQAAGNPSLTTTGIRTNYSVKDMTPNPNNVVTGLPQMIGTELQYTTIPSLDADAPLSAAVVALSVETQNFGTIDFTIDFEVVPVPEIVELAAGLDSTFTTGERDYDQTETTEDNIPVTITAKSGGSIDPIVEAELQDLLEYSFYDFAQDPENNPGAVKLPGYPVNAGKYTVKVELGEHAHRRYKAEDPAYVDFEIIPRSVVIQANPELYEMFTNTGFPADLWVWPIGYQVVWEDDGVTAGVLPGDILFQNGVVPEVDFSSVTPPTTEGTFPLPIQYQPGTPDVNPNYLVVPDNGNPAYLGYATLKLVEQDTDWEKNGRFITTPALDSPHTAYGWFREMEVEYERFTIAEDPNSATPWLLRLMNDSGAVLASSVQLETSHRDPQTFQFLGAAPATPQQEKDIGSFVASLDKIAPEIKEINIQPQPTNVMARVIEVKVYDEHAGIDTVTLTAPDGTAVPLNSGTSPFIIGTPGDQAVTYYGVATMEGNYQVKVSDRAGNEAEAYSAYVYLRQVSMTIEENGVDKTDGTITLDLNPANNSSATELLAKVVGAVYGTDFNYYTWAIVPQNSGDPAPVTLAPDATGERVGVVAVQEGTADISVTIMDGQGYEGITAKVTVTVVDTTPPDPPDPSDRDLYIELWMNGSMVRIPPAAVQELNLPGDGSPLEVNIHAVNGITGANAAVCGVDFQYYKWDYEKDSSSGLLVNMAKTYTGEGEDNTFRFQEQGAVSIWVVDSNGAFDDRAVVQLKINDPNNPIDPPDPPDPEPKELSIQLLNDGQPVPDGHRFALDLQNDTPFNLSAVNSVTGKNAAVCGVDFDSYLWSYSYNPDSSVISGQSLTTLENEINSMALKKQGSVTITVSASDTFKDSVTVYLVINDRENPVDPPDPPDPEEKQLYIQILNDGRAVARNHRFDLDLHADTPLRLSAINASMGDNAAVCGVDFDSYRWTYSYSPNSSVISGQSLSTLEAEINKIDLKAQGAVAITISASDTFSDHVNLTLVINDPDNTTEPPDPPDPPDPPIVVPPIDPPGPDGPDGPGGVIPPDVIDPDPSEVELIFEPLPADRQAVMRQDLASSPDATIRAFTSAHPDWETNVWFQRVRLVYKGTDIDVPLKGNVTLYFSYPDGRDRDYLLVHRRDGLVPLAYQYYRSTVGFETHTLGEFAMLWYEDNGNGGGNNGGGNNGGGSSGSGGSYRGGSGYSRGSGAERHDLDYWERINRAVTGAEKGGTVHSHPPTYITKCPAYVLENLQDRDVTLVICLNGDRIVIDGLTMRQFLTLDGRLYYTLEELAAIFGNLQISAITSGMLHNPAMGGDDLDWLDIVATDKEGVITASYTVPVPEWYDPAQELPVAVSLLPQGENGKEPFGKGVRTTVVIVLTGAALAGAYWYISRRRRSPVATVSGQLEDRNTSLEFLELPAQETLLPVEKEEEAGVELIRESNDRQQLPHLDKAPTQTQTEIRQQQARSYRSAEGAWEDALYSSKDLHSGDGSTGLKGKSPIGRKSPVIKASELAAMVQARPIASQSRSAAYARKAQAAGMAPRPAASTAPVAPPQEAMPPKRNPLTAPRTPDESFHYVVDEGKRLRDMLQSGQITREEYECRLKFLIMYG